jgi:diaminopimelate decarboxylase
MDPARERFLLELAGTRGTPCYVVFLADVRRRVAALRSAFAGRFVVSYAVKANPNADLLRALVGVVDRLDVSSGGELVRALECGHAPERIGFTGPGKRDEELALAVRHGIGELVLESVPEARRLSAIAQQMDRDVSVMVRIAPAYVPAGFGDHMAGRATAFGIDEDELDDAMREILALPRLRCVGLHVYAGTQSLKAAAVAENWRNFAALFRRTAERHALRPARLVFGAGLGIVYHDGQTPIDLAAVAAGTADMLAELRDDPRCGAAELVLETGRYLVGEAGVYLTKVIATKRSRGVDVAICDGGMNHHLAAAGLLGMVVRRPFRLRKLGAPAPDGTPVLIAGPLCTTLDSFGKDVKLGPLREGDVVAIEPSGAYGMTSSPTMFISHPPPAEHLVDAEP